MQNIVKDIQTVIAFELYLTKMIEIATKSCNKIIWVMLQKYL